VYVREQTFYNLKEKIMQKYFLRVRTSKDEGSGTDANVFFTFFGTAGKSVEQGPFTNFETGSIKKIGFSTFESLGDVVHMVIRVVKSDRTTDFTWKPEYIELFTGTHENPDFSAWAMGEVLDCEDECTCLHNIRGCAAGECSPPDVPFSFPDSCFYTSHHSSCACAPPIPDV
jgi:hypothetical protein